MKLSDFSKKPKVKKTSTQFILKNDFKEKSLNEKIISLEAKISFLESIQLERDNAMREMTLAQSHLEDERGEHQKKIEEVGELKKKLVGQNDYLEKIPVLEEELRNQKGNNSSLQNQVNSLEDQLIKKSQEYQAASSNLQSITSERDLLLKTTSEAK